MIPVVEVERDPIFPQRVWKVRVNGMEVPVSSISVERSVEWPTKVVLTFPAEYVEVDPKEQP